jgi:hypothetical protein
MEQETHVAIMAQPLRQERCDHGKKNQRLSEESRVKE